MRINGVDAGGTRPRPAPALARVAPAVIAGGRRSQKRIAFVSQGLFRGGLETVNMALADALPVEQYDVEAVCYRCANDARYQAAHYDAVHVIGIDEFFMAPTDPRLKNELKELFERQRYDLLICACCIAPIEIGYELNIPTVEWWHGDFRHNWRHHPSDWIVSVSEFTAQQGRERRPGCNPIVIHNGVDADAYANGRGGLLASLGIPTDKPIILYAGRVCEAKHVEDIILAASIARDMGQELRVVLLGSDYAQEIDRLKHVASQYGLTWGEDVHHTSIALDDMPRALADATIAMQVSDAEGFCMSLLEAMAAGVPCITTGAGGMKEVGGAAVLYAGVGDVDRMAEHIFNLLTDRAGAATYGAMGQARAREFFTFELQQAKFRALVEEATA